MNYIVIKKIYLEMQMNISNINNSKLVLNIKTNEQKIFCYDSQGIFILKFKNIL